MNETHTPNNLEYQYTQTINLQKCPIESKIIKCDKIYTRMCVCPNLCGLQVVSISISLDCLLKGGLKNS